jgi:hypothetical protein
VKRGAGCPKLHWKMHSFSDDELPMTAANFIKHSNAKLLVTMPSPNHSI